MVIDRKTLRWVFGGVVGCILLYWLLHEADRVRTVWSFIKGLLSPFAIGATMAFILNVPLRGIESRLKFVKRPSIRRSAAIVLTIAAIGLVLYLVIMLLLPQVMSTLRTLIEKLPMFFEGLYQTCYAFIEEHPKMMAWIYENTDLESIQWGSVIEKAMSVVGNSITKILGSTFSAIGNVSSGIFDGVIAIVFSLYCLAQKETLARQGRKLLYAFLPEKFSDDTIRILRLTNKTFSNFISGQCLEAVILGCLFAVSMLIFRMPYIPLVSVLIAVTALVPIVGAFVGCIFGAFFIFVDDPMKALWFVVMFLVLQQFEGNVIYPKVVGNSVGLPGMWVLLAVTVGGGLMGVAGMLLMIPLFSVLYTVLRELTKLRLEARGIDREKLVAHPPELRNRLVERHEKVKQKWALKKRNNKEESAKDE